MKNRLSKKILGLTMGAIALGTAVMADPIVLPDLGVTADDVVTSGVTEGGAVIGKGLAFAVAIVVVFFGFKMVRKVLKPA